MHSTPLVSAALIFAYTLTSDRTPAHASCTHTMMRTVRHTFLHTNSTRAVLTL
ncbi:hypothetical protein TPADAL_0795 [Treponema pallidum subsp. pallidum DAL-1]|uniref:Uncharacterized protein TP_0795 n=4 Tax=Treponema pallidum TaxID=160 RepID=Y795_TREPA|nr:RecName: Full=Uncharacterized protein TP_0795 [Treponema pallidum subsp. pallidum str. Nichols]ACD71213.1 hypothetical protein TPASS_0795 [Treponema pallidum subsp. pallidum SS14]ADD72889.1 conserved hypothetical protein [Treponema pallidum subsp. pallidum str. Chicago]AEZ57925.1 hypothetical protein TPESAMD_0795 [Treponema pallidum subsp. pertenue str. SamoaD]AEZ58994.1 hypothetical protein TPECDC2_0795 [Treponema pallidum subsp. pertenue str. CDC2]AEZ60062.1 hypothetical protein TPEGAU_07